MLTEEICKVFIVFNKSDLLSGQIKDHEQLDQLKLANNDVLRRLDGLFSGKIEYQVTSAATNRGLIKLAGKLALHTLDESSDSEKEKMKEIFEAAENEIFGEANDCLLYTSPSPRD